MQPVPSAGSLEAWKQMHSLDASNLLDRLAYLIVTLYLLAGTTVFSLLEGWSYPDSLYFSMVTLSTVGYGDLVPKTPYAKAVCCIFILIGVSLVSASMGAVLGRMAGSSSARPTSGRSTEHGHLHSALAASGTMTGIVFMGALLAHGLEGWGAIDALYWSVVTCSSVGFGDFAPSAHSRPVALLLILPAVGVFAMQAARLARIVMNAEVERAVVRFISRGVSVEMIREIDADGSGSVERHEFLAYMLVKTGKLERVDIERIDSLFHALDRDGSGTIDEGDVR